jgi:hypothetical protein
LREIRGRRPLRALEAESGIGRGYLSEIETGHRLPRDEWIEGMERAYGAPMTDFYPPEILIVLRYPEAEPE